MTLAHLFLPGLLLGYSTITSHFGPRKSPTTGRQSYHYGLDIGAPTGSNIVAIFSGQVTFTGFSGANGFTVTITNGNICASYSHVSPTFLVYKGQYVNQGEIIAIVGPKNVYGVPNNPYKDSNGNPTNGSTTGPHLHLSIKKDGKAVNPLNYF
ncbi:MAG: M23 family metallopeptidase [Clostridia bacterium]|nr:M23 family metallopeptidase [Clostridia bacterium]